MGPKGLETTIYTDALLLGWGAIMGPHKRLGDGSSVEGSSIFCLFSRRLTHIDHDRQYVKAYINCQGGVISGWSNEWARHIWLWVAEIAHSIRALHIPGKNNNAVDTLSRGGPHAEDWTLNPAIVELLWERFGRARVDLFAAKANHKCPLWFSLTPSDQAPLGLNALGQTRWPRVLLYAFPPYSLLVDLLRRLRTRAQG